MATKKVRFADEPEYFEESEYGTDDMPLSQIATLFRPIPDNKVVILQQLIETTQRLDLPDRTARFNELLNEAYGRAEVDAIRDACMRLLYAERSILDYEEATGEVLNREDRSAIAARWEAVPPERDALDSYLEYYRKILESTKAEYNAAAAEVHEIETQLNKEVTKQTQDTVSQKVVDKTIFVYTEEAPGSEFLKDSQRLSIAKSLREAAKRGMKAFEEEEHAIQKILERLTMENRGAGDSPLSIISELNAKSSARWEKAKESLAENDRLREARRNRTTTLTMENKAAKDVEPPITDSELRVWQTQILEHVEIKREIDSKERTRIKTDVMKSLKAVQKSGDRAALAKSIAFLKTFHSSSKDTSNEDIAKNSEKLLQETTAAPITTLLKPKASKPRKTPSQPPGFKAAPAATSSNDEEDIMVDLDMHVAEPAPASAPVVTGEPSKTQTKMAEAIANRWWKAHPRGKTRDMNTASKKIVTMAKDYVPNKNDFRGLDDGSRHLVKWSR